MYAVLSMNDSLESLAGSLHHQFVLVTGSSQVRAEACERACYELEREPDIGCVVSWSGVSTSWDVGDAVRLDAILCRSSAVRHLIQGGFRPLVGLWELDASLRHAGWRVRMLAEPLSGIVKDDGFSAGRAQFARELYDCATEQLLAQGPRVLKRSVFYSAWQAWSRLCKGSPWHREAGFLAQSVWSGLRGDRSRLTEGDWRESRLPFRFPTPKKGPKTAVLLFTALRPWYLRRALRALHQHWPDEAPPRLIISQDGGERTTTSMISGLAPQVAHFQFQQKVVIPRSAWSKGLAPYYRIAQHFGASIKRVFQEFPAIERLIVLEDDIEIGGDFFPFMERFAPLLDCDPSLLAVSAWNDHAHYASCAETVHRTDCFPGQGWMISRKGWQSLEADWPDTFWDEWLRRPEVRLGRCFLRPELNRVRNFGRSGTGSPDFFDRFIRPLRWQEVALESERVTPPQSGHEYRDWLWSRMAQAPRVERLDEIGETDAVLVYEDEDDFVRVAERLGIVPAYHSSGPRAAFDGVVVLRVRRVQLFLVPRDTLTRVSSGV